MNETDQKIRVVCLPWPKQFERHSGVTSYVEIKSSYFVLEDRGKKLISACRQSPRNLSSLLATFDETMN